MRVQPGLIFCTQADEFAQSGHVEIDIQTGAVALRRPQCFRQCLHHFVFGFQPAAFGAQGVVDCAYAVRLVYARLFLDGQMQRHMQEGVAFAVFGQPVGVQMVFDAFEIAVVFGMGFDNAEGFLFQCAQLQRIEPLLPHAGEKVADIVGIDIVHGGFGKMFMEIGSDNGGFYIN